MMYDSISKFIVLVFIWTIQLLCEKSMLLLNLCCIIHPRCPQQASLFQENTQWIHKNSMYPGRKNHIFKGNFYVPNPLSRLSIPVLNRSGQVFLVAAECKNDLSQSAKAICYGIGRYEDISLYLSMVFPNSPLVGLYTRDFSMVDQIFTGILPSEEVI